MAADQEKTQIVAATRTAFEAEAIAAALRERGVDVRVLDVATNMVWGGVQLGAEGNVKVVVLEHELAKAKLELESIRSESGSIDWDAVDLGDDPAVQRLVQASRSRRWVWTLVVVLVPAGFGVLALGIDRGDSVLKTMGGVLLMAAIALGISQMLPERRK